MADAQAAALDLPMIGVPVKFSAMSPGVRRLGEHTQEILAEHGYTAAEIADLRVRNVVI
jgi:crotonobetainyl-CoA:carnitine CoA-transferase CaiB-like acyl-CoA transferase